MKKHIKLLLRTLISNNACVEAARTKEPKAYNYIAIIFVLFALFFAALPTCVTGFQQQGGSWISGVTYSFENGMIQLRDQMNIDDKNVRFEIVENDKRQHELQVTNWEKMDTYNWDNVPQSDLHCCIATMPDPEKTGEEKKVHKVLEVFYCPKDADFNLYVEEIAKNINPIGITKENKKEEEANVGRFLEKTTDKDGKDVVKSRSTSFIVFGVTQIQAALFQPGGTAVASSVYGDYQSTPITGKDLIKEILVTSNKPEDIINNCKTFFNQVYMNPRRANTWRSTGIILGVDVGVVVLMGFMVWVLTRGKNNPFRIYSFWDGQKIAYYACLTPGIISLFGFLMSNMAMMLFILGAGVRVMWLSMRTLRYQAPAK